MLSLDLHWLVICCLLRFVLWEMFKHVVPANVAQLMLPGVPRSYLRLTVGRDC